MQIMVIGLGYVGSVAAAGLASTGHRVDGVDIDQSKIDSLKNNILPIKEPGLGETIAEASLKGNLRFSHINEIDKIDQDIVFICVGTPYIEGKGCDRSQVYKTIEWIKNKASEKPLTIVMKSTVPPGTGGDIIKNHLESCAGKYYYVMNPEFLREGRAMHDWFHPDRTVVGGCNDRAVDIISDLYKGSGAPVLKTDITSAEMIKYAANAYLAARISFINEIAGLCERFNADIDTVAKGIGLDNRIGLHFLHAGVGYGGSCFPKDTRALHHICSSNGIDFDLLKSVITVNNRQRSLAVAKLKNKLGKLKKLKIAVLGLAFKPDTDDVRESPALDIIKALHKEGAVISAYDPMAIDKAAAALPLNIRYSQSAADALKGACAVLLVTEWREFIDLDWQGAKELMTEPFVVVDGRNCLQKEKLLNLGFDYTGFGRSS